MLCKFIILNYVTTLRINCRAICVSNFHINVATTNLTYYPYIVGLSSDISIYLAPQF